MRCENSMNRNSSVLFVHRTCCIKLSSRGLELSRIECVRAISRIYSATNDSECVHEMKFCICQGKSRIVAVLEMFLFSFLLVVCRNCVFVLSLEYIQLWMIASVYTRSNSAYGKEKAKLLWCMNVSIQLFPCRMQKLCVRVISRIYSAMNDSECVHEIKFCIWQGKSRIVVVHECFYSAFSLSHAEVVCSCYLSDIFGYVW